MDDLARWLSEQLDADTEAARAAMVKLGDVEWYVGHDLEHPGEWYSVRSEPTCRAVVRVQRVDGEDGERAGVIDGHAVATYIAEHDPARVLREIDAKRRTLTQCRAAEERMDLAMRDNDGDAYKVARAEAKALASVIRRDAAVYGQRPGYRAEWAPTS